MTTYFNNPKTLEELRKQYKNLLKKYHPDNVGGSEEATKDIPNVEVKAFGGLTVEFARECGANALVRGLRAITDFEYELQIAQLNRVIAPDIDTVFLTTNLKYAYLSSSSVKEVAAYGGDISNFVTAGVAEEVHKKFQNKIRGKE